MTSAPSPDSVSAMPVELLPTLESYYDAAPRPLARTETVGPFTLFVATAPDGWPYYARPRLGLRDPLTAADVERVLTRQDELGVPRSLEWLHEVTPSLLTAARAAGLEVRESPLLYLIDEPANHPRWGRASVLEPDDDDLPLSVAAVSAGFAGRDELAAAPVERIARMMRDGLLAVAVAYDDQGDVVGGGSHAPRGQTTEVTGIAVLPRARRHGLGAELAAVLAADARRRGIGTVFLSAQDASVARVYERVGFVRVGTACVAEAPEEDR